MDPGLILNEIALFIALIGTPPEVVDVLWDLTAKVLADFLHSVLMGFLY